MLRTTAGRLAVNEALPADLRDHGTVLDKKAQAALLRAVAQRYPEQYPQVSKRLADLGRTAATLGGGTSFGLEHLHRAPSAERYRQRLRGDLVRVLNDDRLDDRQRHDAVLRHTAAGQQAQMAAVYEDSKREGNPLATQILSGARGNQMNLASLRGSDLLYTDHRGDVIPLPVLHSYSEGLTPAEYWAATYGARKGLLDVKFAVRDSGYFSKLLNQAAHRLVVTADNGDDEPPAGAPRGLPVATDDPDNEGALLAHAAGGYERNTLLTPKILAELKRGGHDRVLVRSPLVGGRPDGGLHARDLGVREHGTLAGRGTLAGNLAAQAVGEPVSQGALESKHTGGVAGQSRTVSGFKTIEQLVQVPRTFEGRAAVAEHDGTVSKIVDAPAGGKHVWVGGHAHYVPAGQEVSVGRGDRVEAGDHLSEGGADVAAAVRHKGIGEGRRYFTEHFVRDARAAGINVHRRNVELLARGLVNHVRLSDELLGHAPDEVVPYQWLEQHYRPRPGHRLTPPRQALGSYLERPALHYSVGTKIRPSVAAELEHFGVKEVAAHPEPPPFEPEMVRGAANLQHDPDFMTRMYGSGLKTSLLDAVHHGGASDELGTSFVPALARGVDFGRRGLVHQPLPGKAAAADVAPAQRAEAEALLKEARRLQPVRPPVPLKVTAQVQNSLPVRRPRPVARVKLAEGPRPPSSTPSRALLARPAPPAAPPPAAPPPAATPAAPPPSSTPSRALLARPAQAQGQGRAPATPVPAAAPGRPGGNAAYYGGQPYERREDFGYGRVDPRLTAAYVSGSPRGEYDPEDELGSAVRLWSGLPGGLSAVSALSGGNPYRGQSQGQGHGQGGGQAPGYGAEAATSSWLPPPADWLPEGHGGAAAPEDTAAAPAAAATPPWLDWLHNAHGGAQLGGLGLQAAGAGLQGASAAAGGLARRAGLQGTAAALNRGAGGLGTVNRGLGFANRGLFWGGSALDAAGVANAYYEGDGRGQALQYAGGMRGALEGLAAVDQPASLTTGLPGAALGALQLGTAHYNPASNVNTIVQGGREIGSAATAAAATGATSQRLFDRGGGGPHPLGPDADLRTARTPGQWFNQAGWRQAGSNIAGNEWWRNWLGVTPVGLAVPNSPVRNVAGAVAGTALSMTDAAGQAIPEAARTFGAAAAQPAQAQALDTRRRALGLPTGRDRTVELNDPATWDWQRIQRWTTPGGLLGGALGR